MARTMANILAMPPATEFNAVPVTASSLLRPDRWRKRIRTASVPIDAGVRRLVNAAASCIPVARVSASCWRTAPVCDQPPATYVRSDAISATVSHAGFDRRIAPNAPPSSPTWGARKWIPSPSTATTSSVCGRIRVSGSSFGSSTPAACAARARTSSSRPLCPRTSRRVVDDSTAGWSSGSTGTRASEPRPRTTLATARSAPTRTASEASSSATSSACCRSVAADRPSAQSTKLTCPPATYTFSALNAPCARCAARKVATLRHRSASTGSLASAAPSAVSGAPGACSSTSTAPPAKPAVTRTIGVRTPARCREQREVGLVLDRLDRREERLIALIAERRRPPRLVEHVGVTLVAADRPAEHGRAVLGVAGEHDRAAPSDTRGDEVGHREVDASEQLAHRRKRRPSPGRTECEVHQRARDPARPRSLRRCRPAGDRPHRCGRSPPVRPHPTAIDGAGG